MKSEIKTISFLFPFNFGAVNCYLIKTVTGFILIDTGFANNRNDLEKELASAGCKPGDLKLIIITHGDSDHTGNCAYLRERYGTKIAIHFSESETVESGDTFLSRKNKRFLILKKIFIMLFYFFFKTGKFEKFKPDIYIDEGFDFSLYGFDAVVLNIPGHSMGSIGILTGEGDLFCGDLLWNMGKQPAFHSVIDDFVEMKASVLKLKSFNIKTVYPGHGKPFLMEDFSKYNDNDRI